jgi:hypothetical protein
VIGMVSKYSDADRERILEDARELLEKKVEAYVPPSEPVRYKRYDPAPEPEPERWLDTAPAATDWSAWETWVNTRIRDALLSERETLLAIMAEAIGTTLRRSLTKERREQKAELEDEVRSLRIELCNLESTLSELRAVIASERAKVIDLPALQLRRAVN